MRGGTFVCSHVDTLHYICCNGSLNCGGSYIDSPAWIKSNKTTINPKILMISAFSSLFPETCASTHTHTHTHTHTDRHRYSKNKWIGLHVQVNAHTKHFNNFLLLLFWWCVFLIHKIKPVLYKCVASVSSLWTFTSVNRTVNMYFIKILSLLKKCFMNIIIENVMTHGWLRKNYVI